MLETPILYIDAYVCDSSPAAVNEAQISKEYEDSNVYLFTIGFYGSGRDGERILKRIAESTGG